MVSFARNATWLAELWQTHGYVESRVHHSWTSESIAHFSRQLNTSSARKDHLVYWHSLNWLPRFTRQPSRSISHLPDKSQEEKPEELSWRLRLGHQGFDPQNAVVWSSSEDNSWWGTAVALPAIIQRQGQGRSLQQVHYNWYRRQ